MKKLLSLLVFLCIISMASAVTFNTGTTDGTVSVPGDYASLKAAADAYNALSGGINANWTIEITDNLDEPAFVCLANLTNGKTLTIKPAAGKSPVVTFSDTSTPGGIYGSFVIGVTQAATVPTASEYFESTNGYVIDGNNGGTPGERNMTFQSVAGNVVGRVITIFGKNNGVVIKNLKVIQGRTGGTVAQGIRWAGGSVDTLMNLAADGGKIENCYLELSANTAGAGAAISFSPTANGTEIAAGTCFNNMEFINNEIVSQQRAFFCDSVGNVKIKGNKITLTGRTGGYTTVGIYHWDANDYNNYTVSIEDNILDITCPTNNAANGAYGILIDSITDLTNNGTVNIQNNILKNFAFTNATALDCLYRGIILNRPRVTYNLEHNSVNLPFSSIVAATTAGNVAAIHIPTNAATSAVNLKNNIIRVAQAGSGMTAHVVYAPGGVLSAAGNDLFGVSGVTMGLVGSNTYADFAAWQTAGYDTTGSGGQNVDPSTTSPAWNADLKFLHYTIPSPLIGVAGSTVLTDIDGESRPSTGACPGADEPHYGSAPTPTPTPSPTPVAGATTKWNQYK